MTPISSRAARATGAAAILGHLWLLAARDDGAAHAVAPIVLSAPTAAAGDGGAAVPAPGLALRPTDVTLTISNSPYYSGNYRASGNSRICETVTLGYPHRAESFTVEFPYDEPDLQVRTLSFDADTLPAGGSTRSFYLSVGVTTPEGGKPPEFVVRANRPQYQET